MGTLTTGVVAPLWLASGFGALDGPLGSCSLKTVEGPLSLLAGVFFVLYCQGTKLTG